MVIFASESELLEILDRADAMIAACVAGSLGIHEFIDQLGHLHGYHALDGHESDAEEIAMLARYCSRVEWIERVLEEVGGICADDDASKEAYVKAGRFDSSEALRRLRALVES
ncbi:hypothetical protein OH491_24495 [Termitidicoccus mucosus]|uniref:Uncharacterized protein n=1 Tax=Termitidicoccus mucosus TaxID=1184151 RepID=A0A178IP10_9BACT|nr:hypothetical protein AW736_01995 [Opitutaceae bacterium TSB47]